MAAWLRQMWACNLADSIRTLHRAKRDVARERSLEAALEEPSARIESRLVIEPTRFEVRPHLKDLNFSEGGPRAMLVVVRRAG